MRNPIDLTFKTILKIRRALSLFITTMFLVTGIILLILNKEIENQIYIILGIEFLLISSIELMQEYVNRAYRNTYNHIATYLFIFVVGILMLTTFNNDFYIVGIMWAVATIVSAITSINEGLHLLNERKAFSFINLAFSAVEIVFSILMLIQPDENEEHFITHIYLLGTSLLIESGEELLRVFSPLLAKVPGVSNLKVIEKIAEEEGQQEEK